MIDQRQSLESTIFVRMPASDYGFLPRSSEWRGRRAGIGMAMSRLMGDLQLVNGSTGDPVLLIDYPGRDDAILLDGGDNCALSLERLADLRAVFITHHHVDHFIGLDRIVRANIDADKTVTIHGPVGTIAKIYERINAYEYPFFPFQKIVLDLVEIETDHLRVARVDCGQRFPRPEVREVPREGPCVFSTDTLAVEACFADHTVPCLSYAVQEKPGLYLDLPALRAAGGRIDKQTLRVLEDLRQGTTREQPIMVGEQSLSAAEFAERFVVSSTGAKLGFVTDTAMSPMARPRLLELVRGAQRLYCDAFYLEAQAASAEKHRHSTARRAAELARDAEVEELVLIHFATRYAGRYAQLVDEAQQIFPRTRAEFR